MSSVLPTPTPEALAEMLLCARYGDPSDLSDLSDFVETYGPSWLAEAVDERGNTALHMAAGNGHTAIVSFLLPLLPAPALYSQNKALSTPLHWAALNYHLPTLRLLCPLLPPSAFLILNSQSKNPVQGAEEACEAFAVPEGEEEKESSERRRERVRREVVVGYLLECMGLTGEKESVKGGDGEEARLVGKVEKMGISEGIIKVEGDAA